MFGIGGRVVMAVALAVAAGGCHLGPCATIEGRHNDLHVFEFQAEEDEFRACAQAGTCLPLCQALVAPEASGIVVDECRRTAVSQGASGQEITLTIRYHYSTCD